MNRSVLLISHEDMTLHDPRAGHPERPDRLRALLTMLDDDSIAGTTREQAQPAPIEPITRVHAAAYVDSILALRGTSKTLDDDTAVSPRSVDAALLAAGASIRAVEAIVKEEHDASFALVRPPGHHAERDRAMGFCLFNNIAIAAQHAIDNLGIERVMIVDFDVHHANGTQHIFEDRPDVLVVTSQQEGLWPGTGAMDEIGTGAGMGRTVNIPLPEGDDGTEAIAAYASLLPRVAGAFEPQLILVSAGYDADARDPLAQLSWTLETFPVLVSILRAVAREHTNDRLALFLEGGYSLDALTDGVRASIGVLRAEHAQSVDVSTSELASMITRLLARHWPAGTFNGSTT